MKNRFKSLCIVVSAVCIPMGYTNCAKAQTVIRQNELVTEGELCIPTSDPAYIGYGATTTKFVGAPILISTVPIHRVWSCFKPICECKEDDPDHPGKLRVKTHYATWPSTLYGAAKTSGWSLSAGGSMGDMSIGASWSESTTTSVTLNVPTITLTVKCPAAKLSRLTIKKTKQETSQNVYVAHCLLDTGPFPGLRWTKYDLAGGLSSLATKRYDYLFDTSIKTYNDDCTSPDFNHNDNT